MRFLSETILDAMLFMLSGYALADGRPVDSPVEMIIANVTPSAATAVRPIAEPQSYLQRFETEYQAAKGNPIYTQIKNLYRAQLAYDSPIGIRMTPPASAAPEQASTFRIDASSAPQLTLVQSPNTALPGGGRPQRRLALMVSEWTISGSARVFQSNKSATLTVRRRF